MALDMFDRLIAREGGDKVVNIPGDSGGLTKFGISQRAYPHLDIANLTYDGARAIYLKDYWQANNLQLLPSQLQEPMLDWVVHSGPRPAVLTLQRLCGVDTDGQIGPRTALAAGINPAYLAMALARERMLFLIKKVEQDVSKLKFLRGWLSRVMGLILPL